MRTISDVKKDLSWIMSFVKTSRMAGYKVDAHELKSILDKLYEERAEIEQENWIECYQEWNSDLQKETK